MRRRKDSYEFLGYRGKTLAERGLRYIADSPPPPSGFHPEAVATAKRALRLIAKLRREARHAR